jgi:hypothetical protein
MKTTDLYRQHGISDATGSIDRDAKIRRIRAFSFRWISESYIKLV